MTIDALTEMELNAIRRMIELAESGRCDGVRLTAREARCLLDEATGTDWAGKLAEAQDELEQWQEGAWARAEEIRTLKTQIEDLTAKLANAGGK